MQKMSTVKKEIITAICIALCVVLPQAFHAIPRAGAIYLPMHSPVLLCGLICGWQYGAVVGFVLLFLANLIGGFFNFFRCFFKHFSGFGSSLQGRF